MKTIKKNVGKRKKRNIPKAMGLLPLQKKWLEARSSPVVGRAQPKISMLAHCVFCSLTPLYTKLLLIFFFFIRTKNKASTHRRSFFISTAWNITAWIIKLFYSKICFEMRIRLFFFLSAAVTCGWRRPHDTSCLRFIRSPFVSLHASVQAPSNHYLRYS